MSPEAADKVHELRKACQCLYIEVHASIADDVKEKAEAVIAELEAAPVESVVEPPPFNLMEYAESQRRAEEKS